VARSPAAALAPVISHFATVHDIKDINANSDAANGV
jgi:hypothetical protein